MFGHCDRAKNNIKLKARVFLVRLLALLTFAGQSRFCLVGLLSLIIGLAIDGPVLIDGKLAIDLSGWSLWNELMSFLRCYTVEIGSQIFSSFG